MIGGLELTPFFMIAGIVTALLVAGALLGERVRIPVAASAGRVQSTVRVLRTPVGITTWPPAAVWLAFLVSGAVNLIWMLVVALLVAALFVLALRTLRAVHKERGDITIPGPVAAVLVSLLVLLEFHWLLVVRLAVAPDPNGGLLDGLSLSSLESGAQAIILPASGLAAALVTVRSGRHLVDRVRPFIRPVLDPARRWVQTLPEKVRRLGIPTLLFVLFAAPAVPYLGGSGQLTFLYIATPEFGKILYLWVLAVVAARYLVTSNAGRGRWWRPSRRLTYPAGLFLIVAAGSVIRLDLGPLIPVFAGTLGVAWCALRDEADREVAALTTTASGQRREAARTARRNFLSDLKIPLVIILIFVLAALASDYVQVRLDVRLHAWAYNWNALCTDPPPQVVDVPVGPDGSDVCLRNLRSAVAGDRSQVAKAVAAVADGGLWGRGLNDSRSRIVPLSATDFVIAALWNKLGGLVVVSAGALLALLTFALSRAVWRLRPGSEPGSRIPPAADRSRLFTAGLVASLLGQYLFVLFATLNWVPHSGITAPFLSRGGQSTLALAVGIVVALAAGYASGNGTTVPVPAGSAPATGAGTATAPRRPRTPPRRGAAIVAVVVVGAGALITERPYGGYPEDRPLCPYSSAVNEPQTCTTDLLAFGRTRIEIGFPDGSRFTRLQADPRWNRIAGTGPDPAALGGLLQVPGSQIGLVELGLPGVMGSTRGTSLQDRLLPHLADGGPDGSAELTIDPILQAATTRALTGDGPPEAPPLAGGAVLLDAHTGQLLAAASAPTSIPDPPGPRITLDRQALSTFSAANPYSQLGVNGLAPPADDKCQIELGIQDNDASCYRFYPTGRVGPGAAEQQKEERRYVGVLAGDEQARLPKATTNRAIGELYGPGSTFKVVTAAAYLAMPDTSPDDLIEARTELDVGGERPIRNANRGPCFGARAGKITVRQALAVSCNTAFVELAGSIGWNRVRDMAVAFGFHVGSAEPGVPGSVAAEPSHVPDSAPGAAIGNVGLGGGDVVSTPLEMASVMATIANGGQRVEPTMATTIRMPGTDTPVTVTPQRSTPITAQQAVALRSALQDTTSEDAHGTARKLHAPDNRQLWIKTGTHALLQDDEPSPPHRFVRQIAWMTGFFETEKGPVAFAVALETSDQDQGGARARAVASQLISAVVARRG